MSQESNLYGQRSVKRQKRAAESQISVDFTAQMTALIAGDDDPGLTSWSRQRTQHRERTPGSAGRSLGKAPGRPKEMLKLKKTTTTHEEESELERSRRRLEEKAWLYSEMKKGDYIPRENELAPLVDFDRKWAEENDDDDRNDECSDSEAAAADEEELIEFEDEFGRTRRATRSQMEIIEKRHERGLRGARELEGMSARPAAPQNLIRGDAIQTMAFSPDDRAKMEELARKRDRSATPPEAKHYDADAEIRDKGVGFYKFSKDEETRKKEMEALKDERLATDTHRRGQGERKAARQRELEARRREIKTRKAKKMADSFLDVLATDIGSG